MHIDNVIFLILSKNAYTKFSAGPMFKIIFESVTFDTFQVTIDGSPQKVTYRSSLSNNDVIYLTISFDDSPYFSAKLLSQVNDRLISGKHRKDFYIINSYDEPSEYFCEKLAPRFGKFERLMRSFIYISLTKNLGFDWFESTFTAEIQSDIKNKGNIGKADLIERGLYEMTFAQLYDYLFKAFSYCSAENVVYEQLLSKDLNDILEDFYRVGFWGNVNRTGGQYIWRWNHKGDTGVLTGNGWELAIHNALCSELSIVL